MRPRDVIAVLGDVLLVIIWIVLLLLLITLGQIVLTWRAG